MFMDLLPLAQFNAPSGTTASAPAGAAATPAAPAAAPTAATAATAGAGSAATPEATVSTGTPPTSSSKPAEPPSLLGNLGPLLIMGLMLAGLYFFMTRGQRKEE